VLNKCFALTRTALVLASFTLAACATTAPTPPKPFPVPLKFREEGLWKRAALNASTVPEAWWGLFDDPVLNDLQRRLVIGNESLRSAVAQVASAKAALQSSQAALWPSLSATATGGRSVSPPASGSTRVTANSYSVAANAAWELDLWGRLSHAVAAAGASYQASQDDLAAARLSAQSTLVQTYFALRTAEAQSALLQSTAAADQRSLELTQARYAAGVVGRTDVLQAQTQLKTVQAQSKETAIQRAQLEHAIAVLLGKPPSSATVTQSGVLPRLPAVPKLLPAKLLERRPDIASAERSVAAAYAQIGVADAAFFPDISLSAGAGYRASSLSRLIGAPNLLWSLGSALSATIFDGGARRAASDQARAATDLATSTYRQTVLTAFQEVEDNLVAADQLDDELQLLGDALKAARRSLELIQDQYKAGTVSYLNVVTAQTVVLSAEASVLAVRNRQLAATNALLKNIGGRW
jgi:NodT family efflux transporter outer membrane factor (OMF) lipoprotein